MPAKFSTTIKQVYWSMKLLDHSFVGHFWEYKEDIKHWKRLEKLSAPCDGVFLLGNKHIRVKILEIKKIKRIHMPERYASQISTKDCWALKCQLVETAP
ncbi:MAG: hypothetical protein UY48_C0013G0031 [Candidatus Gottesmanbacteria bacterium GW2011_GWB1_49_7]|uniref:Uncharacterized protein n=1 Tax=Candidatus Gottesmanbacteria bacterium GW2011_GWB1_49_7 TaxID=1618448 RepID=A0A0G1VZJ4_9BACT|nr:MAG: hypothetical protein UY48_C0013G0031 [Candidatus Gottesmanbacteria bacterium GW2011_GWB1_49_7]